MYAAILYLTFPPENHTSVIAYLSNEMGPVIRDNPGFLDFRVLDRGTAGDLVMIDTWESQEDSAAAAARPGAVEVHERYTALGIEVSSAARYEVAAVVARPEPA
jgi:quinol monooxygenase YgiN